MDAKAILKGVEPENRRIQGWYMEAYPSDEMGAEIDPMVTFMDLFETLDRRGCVYEKLGVADSVVRERVFEELAKVMGVEYEYVYNQWRL